MIMPALSAQPYLLFGGRCEEALEFYQRAVGAKVDQVMRFKDNPDPMPPGTLAPGLENKIMHTSFRIGESLVMASDGMNASQTVSGTSLAVAVKTEAEVDTIFNALAAGGTVTMPPGKTFWSPRFGMLTDKFGLGWMVMVGE
jgi:PhnB protein